MTALTIGLLAIIAGLATLIFVYGHKRGRLSRRHDHRNGYLEGVRAEAARWEKVTGTGFGRLQAWRTGRGPDPFANLAAVTEVLPSTEVLLAEADARLGKPRIPSDAELDEWMERFLVAQKGGDGQRSDAPDHRDPGWPVNGVPAEPGPPVVADITDAARWRPFEDDTPTVTGVVVEPSRDHDPGADWELLAGSTLPDYAAAALGGHRTVDECVDSIVMRAVRS